MLVEVEHLHGPYCNLIIYSTPLVRDPIYFSLILFLQGRRYTTPRITNAYDYVIDPIPIVPAGEWNYNITVLHERNGSEVVVVWWSDYYEIKTLTAEQF